MNARMRSTLVWAAAVGMCGLTAGLAQWQWTRAHAKAALQAQAEARQSAQPWGNAQWPCAQPVAQAPDTEASRFQPAALRGQWWPQGAVWLDNRPMDGQAGFILVMPLRLSQPAACRGQVVLVERGWVPRDQSARDRVPPLPGGTAASGEVTVTGHLEPQLSATYALGREPDGGRLPDGGATASPIRQNAPPDFWRRWLGATQGADGDLAFTLSPAVLRQHDASPHGSPDGLRRHWPLGWQGTSPERHRAYAVQWAALSLLTLGLAFWFLVIQRKPHDHQPHAETFHA